MIPEIGQLCLIVALMVALVQAALGYRHARHPGWPVGGLVRSAAVVSSVLVLGAFACLSYSFYANDFSVLYVAENSNTTLPLVYRLCAVWGGHEGSLLLWVLMLAGWQFAVRWLSGSLPDAVVGAVLATMALVMVGFIVFMLAASDPFERLVPAAVEGRDLNPLLQDPGMVIHPPMLYMGYVGFSVVFAFAIAALITGRLDATWARWVRPWTTAAWCFLTVGIMLGSAWAYYVLGWGGWWFWDPVENASFMPWLVGTALIHSLAVTERRRAFKSWTVLLAILTFSLSLLGTFLVRSGVLTSVHAFAADPKRGIFILLFLGLVVGAALALYAWRFATLGGGSGFGIVSRESALLANNVLLVVAAATVLLGTLYPLLLDVLGFGKISVGPPYFDSVFVPLMAPLVFLLGVATVAGWGHNPLPALAARLRWSAAVAVVSAIVVPLAQGKFTLGTAGGLLMASWIVATSLNAVFERGHESADKRGWLGALMRQPASFYGMTLAHLGVAAFIVGVTMVKGYEVERDVRLTPGDVAVVGDYRFQFERVRPHAGPNYDAQIGSLSVERAGVTTRLQPEKRVYRAQQTPVTVAAIDSGFSRDLYVALGDAVDETALPERTAWTIRLHVKPFVSWIWGGWLLMALGGAIAVFDRRYSAARQRRLEAVSTRASAGDAPVGAVVPGAGARP
ncbi:MAG TPA: heme lyase CcmF/NrfE family subunit [Burkholderiaceae bacterium]|nr:heme lyase CcmF/NrfE family subunit [Burkholderiaceae bacterium]